MAIWNGQKTVVPFSKKNNCNFFLHETRYKIVYYISQERTLSCGEGKIKDSNYIDRCRQIFTLVIPVVTRLHNLVKVGYKINIHLK